MLPFALGHIKGECWVHRLFAEDKTKCRWKRKPSYFLVKKQGNKHSVWGTERKNTQDSTKLLGCHGGATSLSLRVGLWLTSLLHSTSLGGINSQGRDGELRGSLWYCC